MQPNELRAVLEQTKEVAIKPVHVEVEVENSRVGKFGRGRRGQLYCPTGLVRATVIEDGVKWTENRVVAVCGDQEYQVHRKNGVLVEIDLDDLPNWDTGNMHISGKKVYIKNGSKSVKQMPVYPHTTAVHRDGKTFLHMITSRKAIFAAWGEYALDIARREKEIADDEAKNDALRNPQAAIMGLTREEFNKLHVNNTSERGIYLSSEWTQVHKRDAKGNYVHETVIIDGWSRKERVIEREVGKIEITVDRANEILNALSPAAKKKLGIPKNV